MRQKTLRVFEVDDLDELKRVVEAKLPLVKNHFFMLKESNSEIEEFLKDKGLKYFIVNSNVVEVKKEIVEVVKEIIPPTKIFDRVIRGGEELEVNGDAVFLGRINPGAKVKVKGNCYIFENNGVVEVEGDFLVVVKNNSRVLFNYQEIGNIKSCSIFTKGQNNETKNN